MFLFSLFGNFNFTSVNMGCFHRQTLCYKSLLTFPSQHIHIPIVPKNGRFLPLQASHFRLCLQSQPNNQTRMLFSTFEAHKSSESMARRNQQSRSQSPTAKPPTFLFHNLPQPPDSVSTLFCRVARTLSLDLFRFTF